MFQDSSGKTKVSSQDPRIKRDGLLIKRFINDDKTAFDEIMSFYEPDVKKQLSRRNVPLEDIDDVSQEVFIRLYRYIHKFKEEALFSTWLYQITYHTFLDYTEKIKKDKTCLATLQKVTLEESHLHQSLDPFNEAYEKLTYEKFVSAILTLPEIFHKVVTMREIDDLQYEDIARYMNVSVGTVRSRLSRARKRMRQIIYPEINQSFA